jgi:hypothetical protein
MVCPCEFGENLYEIGRRIVPEEVYHDCKIFKNGKNSKESIIYENP